MCFMTQLHDAHVATRFAEFQGRTIIPSSSPARTKTDTTEIVFSIRGSVHDIFGCILEIISIWEIKVCHFKVRMSSTTPLSYPYSDSHLPLPIAEPKTSMRLSGFQYVNPALP